jgi:predicted dehydrogenase
MSSDKVRWGILGTGTVAKLFAGALDGLEDAELAAVGSRTQAGAEAFGEQFPVSRCHGSYEALVSDPDVDVVYVATPHSLHCEHTVLALRSDKPVLCEKPFAINACQAEEMIRCARQREIFLMEAMWNRFFPLMARLRELLNAGAIGEPRILTADFGFRADFEPESILFDRKYGGGSLLDVGVYGVSLSSMLFGPPVTIKGSAHIGSTGVDEASALILEFPAGELAVLHSALRVETPQEAIVTGSKGRIRLTSPWWKPSEMVVECQGDAPETLRFPCDGNGYSYEAEAVMQCLRTSRLESELMPLDESLQVMQTLDRARSELGLRYPMEEPDREESTE